jgi:hypothetical protein
MTSPSRRRCAPPPRRAAQIGAIPLPAIRRNSLTRRRSSRYYSYASYYFQLRTLCQRENREFHLKPMDVETAAKLEARGIAYAQKFAKAAGKTWQSANDIDAPKTSIAAMAIRHNSGEVPAAPGGGTTAPLRGGGTL